MAAELVAMAAVVPVNRWCRLPAYTENLFALGRIRPLVLLVFFGVTHLC
jgi:hypothetical protein